MLLCIVNDYSETCLTSHEQHVCLFMCLLYSKKQLAAARALNEVSACLGVNQLRYNSIASGMWLNRLYSVAFFARQQHSLHKRCWYLKRYLFIQLNQNVRPNGNKLPLNFCGPFYSRFLPPVVIAIKCIYTRQQNNVDVDIAMSAIVTSMFTFHLGHVHVNVS